MTATIRILAMVLLGAAAVPALAAEASAPRDILLVRHGHYLPDPGADEKLGPGISTLGVAQAQLVGARLAGLPGGIDGHFVSPLQRARDTAAVIGESLPGAAFDVIDDLAECTPPTRRKDLLARTPAEEVASCREQLERLFLARFVPAEGESRTELLVAHGNVTRWLVTRALGVDTSAWLGMSVGHASITHLRVEADGTVRVVAVGDVGHVPTTLRTGAIGDPERSLAVPGPAAD